MAAKGISTSNYTLTVTSSPTVSQLASLINTPGTVVMLGCGYYDSSGNRTGGHMITLVGAGVNAQGQSSPNTIVVNNPEPIALTSNSDVPGNSLEYLSTIATSGALTGDGAIELDPSQYPGQWDSNNLFVIETAMSLNIKTSQQSVNNPTPAAWNLTANQPINLDGGTLPVLAPITGSGGITLGDNGSSGNWQLQAFGTLQLNASDTTTGANTINSGTWMSTISSGTPFGTGSITLYQGTLALSPVAGSSNISLSTASRSGNTLTFVNGAEMDLAPNGNSSLALTIGGNTDGATSNLIRSGTGTLVLAPAGGSGDLGQAEQLIVKGTSSNLPAITNGIVAPYIVVENNDGAASGDFVTYSANGFAKAAYTTASSTPLASAGSNAIYLANVAQTVAAGDTAQVYALNVTTSVGGGSGSTLQVGTQTGGQAGIILDGGTISTTKLALGSSEGVVYTSKAGGTISSAITGSGGLTILGPGTLTLKGANTYTGTTNINSGILNAQNTSGTIADGDIIVNAGATLEISGASAKAGVSGSTTTLANGGELLLNGGTLTGKLNAGSGSYIFGSGTVIGGTTLSGSIGNNGTPSQLSAYTGVENITFTNKVTAANLDYAWTLNALDATASNAGIDWSLLTMKGANTVFGTSSKIAYFTLDLGSSVPDPNSGNAFWNTSHQWLVAEFTNSYSYYYNYDFPSFEQGTFFMNFDSTTNAFYVDYTASGNYWKGGADGTWTGTNWVDGTGTSTSAAPGQGDDVNFSATGAANQGITTVGQDFTIRSLTVSDTNTSVVISSGAGGPYTLSIAGAAGTGITIFTGTNLTINSNVTLGGNSDTIEVDGAGVASITGVLSGSNGIAKTGAGTLTLTGTNTYSGATNVTGGQLYINGVTGSGSALTVATGAMVGGTGAIAGPATINGTVSPGVGVGTITFGGTLSFASTSHLAWGLGSNTMNGDKVMAGATTVAAGAVVDLVFSGAGSTANFFDPFWSQVQTFSILNATALSGTFSLGSIGSDSNGTNPGWLGAFSLQYTATSVNLVWTPSAVWQDTAWQQWQVTNFAGNWNAPAIAGDAAAPAGDSIPNLMKFALGANPWVASTASLPAGSIKTIGGQQYLTLAFTHSLTATNVTCIVNVSGDLSGSWSQGSSYSPSNGDVPANAYTTQVSRTVNGNTETITVRDNQPVTSAVSRRFMQLQVTRP